MSSILENFLNPKNQHTWGLFFRGTQMNTDTKLKEMQKRWLKETVLSEDQFEQLIKNKMERSKIYSQQVRKKFKLG